MRTPSPYCTLKRRHDEHRFKVWGTMSIVDGAHVECPGSDAPPVNPFPEMTAEWKVIRRLADALAECVDHAVESLLEQADDGTIDPEDEDLIGALADYVLDLAVRGEAVWGPA